MAQAINNGNAAVLYLHLMLSHYLLELNSTQIE